MSVQQQSTIRLQQRQDPTGATVANADPSVGGSVSLEGPRLYKVIRGGLHVEVDLSPQQYASFKSAHDSAIGEIKQKHPNAEVVGIDYTNFVATLKEGDSVKKVSLQSLNQAEVIDKIKKIVEDKKLMTSVGTYSFASDDAKAPNKGLSALQHNPALKIPYVKAKTPEDKMGKIRFVLNRMNRFLPWNWGKNVSKLPKMIADKLGIKESNKIAEFAEDFKEVEEVKNELLRVVNEEIQGIEQGITAHEEEMQTLNNEIKEMEPRAQNMAEGQQKTDLETEIQRKKSDLERLSTQQTYQDNKNKLNELNGKKEQIKDIDEVALRWVMMAKQNKDLSCPAKRLEAAKFVQEQLKKWLHEQYNSWISRRMNFNSVKDFDEGAIEYAFYVAAMLLETRDEYVEFARENGRKIRPVSFTESFCDKTLPHIARKRQARNSPDFNLVNKRKELAQDLTGIKLPELIEQEEVE